MILRRTILLALALAARVLPEEVDVHAFCTAYNKWVTLRNTHSTPNSFHAKEPALWLAVKRAWKTFANGVDRFYSFKPPRPRL